eukprot:scaffold742_cov263-Pinguiococcus_pyrenoidosus.AAC.18
MVRMSARAPLSAAPLAICRRVFTVSSGYMTRMLTPLAVAPAMQWCLADHSTLAKLRLSSCTPETNGPSGCDAARVHAPTEASARGAPPT